MKISDHACAFPMFSTGSALITGEGRVDPPKNGNHLSRNIWTLPKKGYKFQMIDVCVGKPFKDYISDEWAEFMINVCESRGVTCLTGTLRGGGAIFFRGNFIRLRIKIPLKNIALPPLRVPARQVNRSWQLPSSNSKRLQPVGCECMGKSEAVEHHQESKGTRNVCGTWSSSGRIRRRSFRGCRTSRRRREELWQNLIAFAESEE